MAVGKDEKKSMRVSCSLYPHEQKRVLSLSFFTWLFLSIGFQKAAGEKCFGLGWDYHYCLNCTLTFGLKRDGWIYSSFEMNTYMHAIIHSTFTILREASLPPFSVMSIRRLKTPVPQLQPCNILGGQPRVASTVQSVSALSCPSCKGLMDMGMFLHVRLVLGVRVHVLGVSSLDAWEYGVCF